MPVGSLQYNILHLFSGLFINADAIIYLQLYNKHQVTKGCKTQLSNISFTRNDFMF